MSKFGQGDVVKVTRAFKGANTWVGRQGVLLEQPTDPNLNHYDWVIGLGGDSTDVLYVYEGEIAHV